MNDLVKALRSGEQADMDGTLVKVSRQACEEAADAIEALQARVLEHDRIVAENDAEIAAARDKALEDAARKADPPQVRTTKGLWVLRREKIAAAIRAMKGERG